MSLYSAKGKETIGKYTILGKLEHEGFTKIYRVSSNGKFANISSFVLILIINFQSIIDNKKLITRSFFIYEIWSLVFQDACD